MSDASHTGSPDPVDPDRLTGWKEVATFLGKGVRTAQRWERDYGLPVHRIGREGGEIIFASRREITAWLDRGGGARGDEQEGPAAADTDGPPSVTDERAAQTRSGARRATWVLTSVVVALASFGLWALLRPTSGPYGWRADRDRLVVYDDQDVVLFEWPLGFAPDIEDRPYLHESGGIGVVEDLDGDGAREVIFGARDAARGLSTAFHVLNADGSLRARIQPDDTVTFGDSPYAAPWLPYRVFVNRRAAGTLAIHLVFIHGLNYPSLLLEIDSQGNTLAEYWSNGYIHDVEYVRWKGKEALAVGASNNDFQGSSLALFESGRATGTAPAGKDAYRCLDCPNDSGSGPSAFVVFPTRCLAQAVNGTGVVGAVWTDATGSFFVRVEEGDRMTDGHLASAATYVLDADLNLLKVEPLSGMFIEHDAWYKRDVIDHPLSPETDSSFLFPVRVWQGGDFADLPAAPIDWSQYGSRSRR
jgi:hypothetical protein